MNTAAAYIRVSTEDQVEFSPDSQLKAVRKYAREHDLILPEEFVFVDEGISGRKADKRPAFQKMIGTAKLKPKPFDVILLWKFSRFARNREDSIVYKSMLRKQCGIDVVSISEQLSEDKTSILIEALIEAMDEYYSLNLAEEVRRGMTEKFSRGGVVSQPPFGYKMGDGVFVPDENTAPIVRMIFGDYISGLGTRQIAAKLNDMDIRTLKGNRWENRTVEYVLTNPTYIGKLRRSKAIDRKDRFHENAELVDGHHQPLISPEIFEAAQKRRSETKRSYTRYARSEPAEFMLKGLVRCDKCGATLTMSGDHSYLQCHRYAKGVCNVSHAVNVNKINKIVIDKLKQDLSNNNFAFESEAAVKKPDAESTAFSHLIQREQNKLMRVKEAYEAGVDTLEEYKENKAKITARIAELQAKETAESTEYRTPEEISAAIAGRIRSNLSTLQSDETSETAKNMLLRSIVDRIIFIRPGNLTEIIYRI